MPFPWGRCFVPPEGEIRFTNVAKGYGKGPRRVEVFRDLSLHIPPQTFACIMGPSGSGKSTLLNLIGGLDLPDAGTIQVCGFELHALSDAERTRFRRGRVGYLFQYHHLLEEFTVLENCLLPLLLQGLKPKEASDKAQRFLKDLKLNHLLDRFPRDLSGGEAQRVALVRAALGGGKLFLADEPTGNLDAQTAKEVMGWVRYLHKQSGWTTVVVTHNPQIAKDADKLFRLDSGIIREIHV